jgi:cell division inhibitor SepF
MANPLRKTMVYLGLADEEFDYDDHNSAQPVHQQSPAAQSQSPGHQSSGHQSSGHGNGQGGKGAHASDSAGRAPVTPLRRPTTSRNAAPVEMNEILTVHPRQYKDAQIIAESFRDGIPVIINLSQMSEPEARRLVDFASGLSQGLYGKIERVTKQVFLLSPAHVVVSGDQADAEPEVDASFFASH